MGHGLDPSSPLCFLFANTLHPVICAHWILPIPWVTSSFLSHESMPVFLSECTGSVPLYFQKYGGMGGFPSRQGNGCDERVFEKILKKNFLTRLLKNEEIMTESHLTAYVGYL